MQPLGLLAGLIPKRPHRVRLHWINNKGENSKDKHGQLSAIWTPSVLSPVEGRQAEVSNNCPLSDSRRTGLSGGGQVVLVVRCCRRSVCASGLPGGVGMGIGRAWLELRVSPVPRGGQTAWPRVERWCEAGLGSLPRPLLAGFQTST